MVSSWLQISFTGMFALGCGDDSGGPTGGGGDQNVTLTARHGHSMVYDEARRQLLLFGGTGTEGTSASADRASTWTWDGTTWRQKATAGPSARVHATIAFDRVRGRVVSFGGFTPTTNQELRDIWEWDGTSWQQSTSSASTGSVSLGVAYDEKTSALYLFSMTGTGFSAHRWNGNAVTAAAAATTRCVPVPRQFVSLGSTPGGFLFYVHTCDLTGRLPSRRPGAETVRRGRV